MTSDMLDIIGCFVAVGMGPDSDDPEDVDAVERLSRIDDRRPPNRHSDIIAMGELGPELGPIGRWIYRWAHGEYPAPRTFQRSPSGHWPPARSGPCVQRTYLRWLDGERFRFARGGP